MSFLKLSNDYVKAGFTSVDNLFLLSYMPNADAIDVKIYLYGLTLAINGQESDNNLQKMSLVLHLSEERIIEGYQQWEKLGIVSILKSSEFEVKYLSVKHPITSAILFDAEEFAPFVDEVNRIFPDKMISPNEFNAYFELMTANKIDNSSMLLIMKYCYDYKAGNVSAPYILAVANDWISQGIKTFEDIENHIQDLENNADSIRDIFKSLGIKRKAEIEDRQYFLKWTNNYNYNIDAILTASKALKKRGGMRRLDEYIQELKKANAYNSIEIAQYTKNKAKNYDLTIAIIKNLGSYYGNPEMVTETYVIPWLNNGFEEEALLLSAKFCFLRNIKTLDGLNNVIERFLSKGLVTAKEINNYIKQESSLDLEIKEFFEKCNYIGSVTANDRKVYKLWKEWDITDEILDCVADFYKDTPYPLQKINRAISLVHSKKITELNDVKKELNEIKSQSSPKKKLKVNMDCHNYDLDNMKLSAAVNFEDME